MPIVFVTNQNTSKDELKALSLGGDASYEEQWYQLMRAAGKSMIEAVSTRGQGAITAAQLICENNRGESPVNPASAVRD